MDKHFLYPLARKLRPELDKLSGPVQLQAFIQVLMVLYLTPFAMIGIAWLLIQKSGPPLTATDILLLLILTVGSIITNNQVFNVYARLGNQSRVTLTSSFGIIFLWVGIFIWGPVMIWFSLLADLISGIYGAWQQSRLNQNVFWVPLSVYLQSLAQVVWYLLGLLAYTTLGGSYPIDNLNLTEWIPALVAIVIASILPGVALLPIYYNVNRSAGSKNTFAGYASFMISIVGVLIVPAPFSIPIAMLFTTAGTLPFLAMVLGILLVNLLAHHLSRTSQRNHQQSREMAQLEQLGEEIIQSAPDGSMLETILHKHIASMFSNPTDIAIVRVFEDVHLLGYSDRYSPIHITHPDNALILDETIWKTLQESEKDYLVLKDQIPNGFKSVYGDAVLVKINSASHGVDGKNNCIGGIYLLLSKNVARTIDSLDTIQALASQIASALYRVQVHQETLIAEKMSQELAFAGTIQATFLPESVPSFDGWSLEASLIPARQTSGDFYDFIPLGENKIGLLIADVADKGTGAALYMALSRTLLRTFAMQYPDSPADVFRLANDRIFEDSRADQFVTVFYGVLDLSLGTFEYCNAGHNPTFLLRSINGHEAEPLKRTGVALGAMEGLTWKSASVSLNSGDALIFYTDGVVEAQNENEEFFGEERLLQSAKTDTISDAKVIHQQIMDGLQFFIGKAAQFDDITLLTLKRG